MVFKVSCFTFKLSFSFSLSLFLPLKMLKGHFPLLLAAEGEVEREVVEVVFEVEAFPSTIRSSDIHLSRMGNGCISRIPDREGREWGEIGEWGNNEERR